MKIIPEKERKKYRCYFCEETKSVKYMMRVFDPVLGNKPCEVPSCNKCALFLSSK